jgi:hypothetical protein
MKLFVFDNSIGYCVSLTVEERLALAQELDRLGIHYIDGGCPATDHVAREFFARCEVRQARLVASAQLADVNGPMERDSTMRALVDCGAPTISLGWPCGHCDEALIREAVRHLKARGREVIFRARHFFESFAADHGTALHTLATAKAAGADVLCLCDSAGECLPHSLRAACIEVRKRFDGVLGICAHDDSDLGVANEMEAVEQGFTLVAGSIRNCHERSGSPSLVTLLGNLELKQRHTAIGAENLAKIPAAADFVAEHSASAAGAGQLAPFEAAGYEVISHSAPDGSSVSAATVTVRIGDLTRSESADGTGPVDALERALRQCLYAIYPCVSDLEIAGYLVEPVGSSRGTAGLMRVTVEWRECGSRRSTAAVSRDVMQAVWIALADGFRLQLARVIDRTREMEPEEIEMWAV